MGGFGGLTCAVAVVGGAVAAAGLSEYIRNDRPGIRLTGDFNGFVCSRRRQFILRWRLRVVGSCGRHYCAVGEMEVCGV